MKSKSTYKIREFKNKVSEALNKVMAGEEVYVQRHGETFQIVVSTYNGEDKVRTGNDIQVEVRTKEEAIGLVGEIFKDMGVENEKPKLVCYACRNPREEVVEEKFFKGKLMGICKECLEKEVYV